MAAWPWRTIRVALAGAVLCGSLVWAGLTWPVELTGVADGAAELVTSGKRAAGVTEPHRFQPFIELLKLVVASLIGLLITAIHQPAVRDRARSMEQAQTLLCVSGAMMMIIIGNSLARAFGIAGAASLIRFRTPVDDPKDVTILFLLMGLGMSAGLGAFAVSGLGTAFLCVALLCLDRMSVQKARAMSVEILAAGRQFPTTHVEHVFARNQIVFEPREISQSDDVFTALIANARHSIRLIEAKLSDPDLVSVPNARRAEGLHVEIFSAKRLGDLKSHGKIMLVDDRTAVVGSLALAALSLDFRREVAIVVTEPSAVAEAAELFRTLGEAAAERVSGAGAADGALC